MVFSRWAVLVCAGAALLTGCSISPSIGETLSECRDNVDNDNDGDMDCKDTDCKAVSECATALADDPSPGQIGDAYVGHAPDAGVSEPVELPDAAQPIDPPDAEVEPSDAAAQDGCAVDCGANQTCSGNVCVDNEPRVVEHWDVTQIEVYAPRSVEQGGSPCLDPACIPYVPRPPFPYCGCPPDPQVQFWVDLDPNDDLESELAGETTVASSRDEPMWSSPGITLRLQPDSEIYMKVLDDDGERDEPMFGCTILAEVVTSGGPMECIELFPLGDSDAVEFHIRAQVGPTQVEPDPPE